MVYVDLNPIRAGISESLDDSEFTSIEQRIKSSDKWDMLSDKDIQKRDQVQEQNKKQEHKAHVKLADFVGGKQIEGIAYLFMDYLELADWTGRVIREDKKGYISDNEPKILKKLGINSDLWFKTLDQYTQHSYSHLGTEEQIKEVCVASGKNWIAGISNCRRLFG